MSLHPQPSMPPIPEDTARIARAVFRRGNPCLLLRDRLGAVFDDAGFADLYPKRGQPAYAPWRLALVTLLQSREGLSDRQAAEAVRARIDWKYLLALDLADPGFDHSLPCEFRGRLLGDDATECLLACVLDAAREGGLLKARGRQRTDNTHVLATVRELNRMELLAETLRAALNVITVAAPDGLRGLAPPAGHERYGKRIEEMRLPGLVPSVTPVSFKSARTGIGCLTRWPTGTRQQVLPRCQRWPCCGACGRGTSSGTSVERMEGRPPRSSCGRWRAAAPASGSSLLTTWMPASGPSPA